MSAHAESVRPAVAARVKPWLLVAPATALLAWGGNHFTPLLLMYRQVDGYSSVEVDLFLAVYIVGLVPGFLIGGPLADRVGRKRVMAAGIVFSALGSAILAAGAASRTGSVPAGSSSGSASRWRSSPARPGSRSSRGSPMTRAPGSRARGAPRWP